jgi:hypothetical protein
MPWRTRSVHPRGPAIFDMLPSASTEKRFRFPRLCSFLKRRFFLFGEASVDPFF